MNDAAISHRLTPFTPDPTPPRRRRLLAAACAAGVVALGVAASAPARASGSATPPPETIAPVGTAPNLFYQGSSKDLQSTDVGMLADPVNHLAFEYQFGASCPFVVDSDTFKVRARATGDVCTAFASVNNATSTTLGLAAAVDPVDHVLLATNNVGGALASLGGGVGQIYVLDEATLHERTIWKLPPQGSPATSPQKQIAGVSWYPKLDELLVLTGNFGNGGLLPGVSVSAYAVGASLKAGHAVVLWTVAVPQCQAAFLPTFASAAAYHATDENDIYVPCVLLAPNPAQIISFTNERDGVVKVPLQTSGCKAPATECPDVLGAAVAVAPGVSNDTLFDPSTDRVFMISAAGAFIGAAVVSILVYSGHLDAFLGTAVVGGTPDASQTAVGFDTTTGRFYVVNTRGLSIIDSRRTPVRPGSIFGQYAETVVPPALFPVLPPDAAYPYTRVIVADDRPGSQNGGLYMPDFTVFADTLAVSADPPADSVDARTIDGPLPAGADIQKSVGGAARGYGWHSDLVGGPDDLGNGGDDLNSAAEFFANTAVNLPLGKGNRDLLGGSVQQLDLRSDGTDGMASALGAADDSTAYDVQQCTDVQQLVNCAQPPVAPPVGAPASAQPTGQLMPFPAATCSQPGPAVDRSQSVDGAWYTTWSRDSQGDWQPAQHQVTGTDQTQSHATVDCDAPASGAAWLRGAGISSPTGGSFTVAAAGTSSQVAPPASGSVVTSTVTATATGIDVELAGGQGGFSIASVAQTASASAGGRDGTAKASDLVVISGVSINGTPVCTTQCDPAMVAAALNQAFPTQLHVDAPAADDSFMSQCTTRPDGERDCLGSPGGYKASVEANLVEQFGDHDFNGMTTNEASILPALRVILYFANDGNPARTREVLDLAGVAATSTLGLSTLPGIVNLPPGELPAALQAATGLPASSPYVAAISGGNVGAAAPQQSSYASGPLGVLERTFDGLRWLVRSPWAALQMIAYLAALAVPIVLARRRRLGAVQAPPP